MHAVQRCAADGSAWEIVEICAPGGVCEDGVCVDPCTVAEQTQRTRGCSFRLSPLDRVAETDIETGVAVTVPIDSDTAWIALNDVTTGDAIASDLAVEPGETRVIPLPSHEPLHGSSKGHSSIQLTSSVPVSVQQLLSLPSSATPLTEASLTLPDHGSGQEFVVSSWPTASNPGGDGVHVGWVNIVSMHHEDTTISLVPRAPVAPGPAGSGLVAGKPNQRMSFSLGAGRVAHLETMPLAGVDWTGTNIRSDHPIQVVVGHECAEVPRRTGLCGAVVEQLTPLAMWGSQVIAVPFKPRSETQVDMWRIVAGANDVQVETHPAQPGYSAFILPKGGFVTLGAQEPFAIVSTGPIAVTQWMTGAFYPGHNTSCPVAGLGAVNATYVPPVEQFSRKGLLMKAPHFDSSYLNLVIPEKTKLWIDDVAAEFSEPTQPVGPWSVVQLPLTLGAHSILSSRRIGMVGYGVGCGAAFSYPGGHRLHTVVPPDPCIPTSGTNDTDKLSCSKYFPDMDGDGTGAQGYGTCLCAPEGVYQVTFGGDCDDYEAATHAWADELCNGIDDNCNGTIDEGCDDDGDGWCDSDLEVVGLPTVCPSGGGDCMDYSALVSPAQLEIENNGLDDDCNGLIDNQLPKEALADCTNIPCVGHTLQTALCATDMCFGPDTVKSISITSPTQSSVDDMWESIAHFGDPQNELVPKGGNSVLAMSTGKVLGTSKSSAMGGVSLTDPYPKFSHDVLDAVDITFTLQAPKGAVGFSVDTVFLSTEFADSVGSASSDKFYILLESPIDSDPIVINHTPCMSSTWDFDLPQGDGEFACFMSVNSTFGQPCSATVTNIDGTGFECDSGSSTGWLRTAWTLENNEPFRVRFLLHDTGDDQNDSTVLIDNFQWTTSPQNGVTPIEE